VAVLGFDMVFAEPAANPALAALERLAANDAALASRLPVLRADLDDDARLARALTGRAAVLGFFLTSDRGARRAGVLPAPAFDAGALQGRHIAFTHWDGYAANVAALAAVVPSAGFFNSVQDGDGVVRSLPLIAEYGGRHYQALALAMFRRYTGAPALAPGFPAERWLPRDYSGLESILLTQGTQTVAIPVDARAAVRVPFRGPGGPGGGSFEYVGASDLLLGRVPQAHLAGKLVLLGSTAPGVYDQRATPVGEVFPGVEVHANLLSGLLDGRLMVEPDWARGFDVAQVMVVAGLLALLLPRLNAVRGMGAMLALLLAVVALNLWLYAARGLVLPLASALLLTALVYAGATSWGYIVEGRSRRSLARLFGSYVPPELVAEMARDPARYDMRAENRVLSIMFCDMRNFTRVSEALAPEEVRGLVNRFFSSMTAAIREYRGTLDKYIGDAIMAFWGAPLEDTAHAEHAVRAAQAMVQRLKVLNDELRARGLPQIGLGIGLNTGLVCVGDMGSDIRRSYTVMGDAVNLASRIEALTRHYGVDILAGVATRDAAGTSIQWLEVDRVRVKGKQQGVTLFTPVPQGAATASWFAEEMQLWQLALQSYRRQHWQDAQSRLDGLQARFASSPFAELYRQFAERVDRYLSTPPPPDWDGTHTFDTK
jgi:adenylate cyclase